jgi:hypothetical protein
VVEKEEVKLTVGSTAGGLLSLQFLEDNKKM